MSDHHVLKAGASHTFLTNVAGHKTNLYMKASNEGLCKVSWRAALCCQEDALVVLDAEQSKFVDISKNGALVVVTNRGYYPVTVWTDY